jgi:hypothetical protein
MGMGKELSGKVFIISLSLIFLLSLAGIGGLYYYINSEKFDSSFKYLPVSQDPISFSLTVSSPEDNTLVQDGSVIVSGRTAPFASLIVIDGEQTTAFDAQSNGDFSKIITLSEGPHVLQINAFDKTGAVKTVSKSVYYTKESLDEN